MVSRPCNPVGKLAVFAAIGAVVVASGCAAMTRTWQFKGSQQANSTLEVSVTKASVAQKAATLHLAIRNVGDVPVAIDTGRFFLSLPDKTRYPGAAKGLKHAKKRFFNKLKRFGIGSGADADKIAPGRKITFSVMFQQYGRDFRRHPWLAIELTSLRVDGQPANLPPLRVTAPPEAPMGEDI